MRGWVTWVKAAILAAGRGERLRPLTETRPKPLLPILGEPLLCRSLEMALTHPRVDEAIIVAPAGLGGEFARLGCVAGRSNVRVVEQAKPLGTGDALRVAVSAGGSDDYLVVFSDVYVSRGLWAKLRGAGPDTVFLVEVENPSEYGVARIEDGVIGGFVEKPEPGREPSRLALAGVYVLSSDALRLLESLKPSPRGELELTEVLSKLAASGGLSYAVIGSQGAWRDVGRPWDYLLAVRHALSHELEPSVEGEVHPTASIEGPVYIAPQARVAANTVVEGPAYLGPGATVGPCSRVRPHTAIHEGARVGFGVEVKASILLEGARVPHLNYVGDSIIGEEVNLGAGTITANLRFDHGTVKMNVKGRRVDTGLRKLGAVIGGHAQTGINVSIMPGVRIGSYARIWPGCVVYRDVPRGAEYRCGPA
jgi:UDP-N-acetylglucosamine diphosphorylase/glucosamine-1-phosphate N-acetyltransferase